MQLINESQLLYHYDLPPFANHNDATSDSDCPWLPFTIILPLGDTPDVQNFVNTKALKRETSSSELNLT